jgi:D-serine deaminase-like pyridoxal phosphate-dependent protein
MTVAAGAASAASSANVAASTLDELGTPFALIDERRLRANVAAMQEAVKDLGAALRPHFKTHRTPQIARLQRDAGAIGLTVATATQLATVTGELGCPALVSSLLQADCATSSTLREAYATGDVTFAVESQRSVELLRAALGPEPRAEVVIEVDAGCRRSGVPPSECAALARVAARQGFDVAGVFSYPGHSYAPGQSREAAEEERRALSGAAVALARAGFEPRHVSAGSTPTMPYARSGVATEYRPGTYVFGDRQQLTLGAVSRAQLSLTVVASVIAVHGERVVLDAGGKALGRDAPRWLEGYGLLANHSEALIGRLYDHHSVIEPYWGERLRVGDRVAIVPNNANSTMALLRAAWATEDGESAVELRPEPDR